MAILSSLPPPAMRRVDGTVEMMTENSKNRKKREIEI
jgi:hypothetical protein